MEMVEEAKQCYENSSKANPQFDDVLSNLGNAYFQLGSLDEAKYFFEKALRMNQKNISALINLGNTYYKTQMKNEAIPYFEKALEMNPNSAFIMRRLGDALISISKEKEAIEYYQKSLEIDSSIKLSNLNLGVIYQNQRATQSSKQYFESEIKVNPQHYKAYSQLGQLYLYQQGNITQAKQYLEIALNIKLDDINTLTILARIHEIQGNIEEAQILLKQVLKINPIDSQAHYEIGIIYQKLNQQQKAKLNFQEQNNQFQKTLEYKNSRIDHQNFQMKQRLKSIQIYDVDIIISAIPSTFKIFQLRI